MREFLRTWLDAFHEHRLLTYATAMAMRAFIGFICLTFLGFALLGSFGDKSIWKKHIAPSIEPKVTHPTFDALNAGDFNTKFIASGVLCILLALLADAFFVGVQRVLTPWASARRAR